MPTAAPKPKLGFSIESIVGKDLDDHHNNHHHHQHRRNDHEELTPSAPDSPRPPGGVAVPMATFPPLAAAYAAMVAEQQQHPLSRPPYMSSGPPTMHHPPPGLGHLVGPGGPFMVSRDPQPLYPWLLAARHSRFLTHRFGGRHLCLYPSPTPVHGLMALW